MRYSLHYFILLFLTLTSVKKATSLASEVSNQVSRRAFGTSTGLLALNSKSTSNEMPNPQYWNRETSARKQYSTTSPITQEANIICISDPNDDANQMLYKGNLPEGAKVLVIGSQMSDFDVEKLKESKANVIFSSHPKAREPLGKLLQEIPSIQWVHSRSAGIDSITSKELAESSVLLTNAKGAFSSTLAEYTMMAIAYFAKDLPRLLKNKNDKNWEKYCIEEIRGKTLAIVGYGDIGRAAAKLAKAYGMNVKALRRNPEKSQDDSICDTVYSNDKKSLHRIMSESDYILCAAPLTPETKGMFDKEAFASAKQNAVFINVGRGPIVEESALIDALKNGPLKGAALDVVATEPLPEDSELWELPNVLISPHNMDMTETFTQEATEFFIEENLPRFLRGELLLNPADKVAGY
jgi:phosphoglycerate dehydrogenase-like enzyme